MSRERLRAVADGYFNPLEQNDGSGSPAFMRLQQGGKWSPDTNNPDFILPIAGLPWKNSSGSAGIA